MATKSPTSVMTREVIGGEQFSQRREVFDKHDTVFLPTPPNTPTYQGTEPVMTTNHEIQTANFKRNTATHSSMRESRIGSDREPVEFRPRKYSDNFTSDLNQGDDIDYRRSMTERTRRLSKLRRDFLASNLHDTSVSPLARKGTRSTMPVGTTYKVQSINLYKFPFAEPYSTPPPVRKSATEVDSVNKENEDGKKIEPRQQSLPINTDIKIDHQKLFEKLVERYSPQRKPIDWTLPPTRPKIVGSVRKSVTSDESNGGKPNGDIAVVDDVFATTDIVNNSIDNVGAQNDKEQAKSVVSTVKVNNDENNDSTISITELVEKNDRVPELSTLQRQLSRDDKRPHADTLMDLNIPALIEKMNVDGNDLEHHKNDKKKVKRKRSFIDKLLGRKKDNRSQ